jgi:hypothetical protein
VAGWPAGRSAGRPAQKLKELEHNTIERVGGHNIVVMHTSCTSESSKYYLGRIRQREKLSQYSMDNQSFVCNALQSMHCIQCIVLYALYSLDCILCIYEL